MALKETSKAQAGSLPASYGAWLLPSYLLGLVLVFTGERLVSSDALRYALSGLGVACAAGTTLVRWILSGKGGGERQAAERALAKASAGGLIALAVYFATTDKGKALLGIAAMKPESRARVESALTAGWGALLIIAVLPLILGEIALAPQRRAAMIEARRVRAAVASGLTLAFALAYAALFTFAAGELSWKADFSYFRTARASESTKKIAASSTDPIVIRAFFPDVNEVGSEVSGYLQEIAAAAPGVKIETYDRLLVPAIAKEAKVTGDGVVVLTRGASREQLFVGTEMKAAAGKLKTLDGDFQKALLKVMRDTRVAYLTVGHGELNEGKGEAAPGELPRSAKWLKAQLESQNYSVKDLGLVQGLGTDVPADATMVVVLGPTAAFMPEEVASLRRYADRGGRLFLALDPDAKIDLAPLAAIAGLTWSPTHLANDKTYVRARYNNSDRGILVTNRFSSHASVSTLSRYASRAHVFFPGVSTLDKGPGDYKVDFAIKSLGDTFDDKDGNFQFDSGSERRSTYNIAAAVTKPVPGGTAPKGSKDAPEMRAFVLADADCVGDPAMGNDPNKLIFADAARWLGGEESFAGTIATPEDVRIEHTKQKDVIWFYATIVGAPALVLGVGLIVARRRPRGAKPAEKKAKPAEEKAA